MKPDKKTAAHVDIFTQLCDIFAPGDKTVRTAVVAAVTDPAAAPKQLLTWDAEWSPQETTDNLAWVTLAMALTARRRAVAIDDRASSDELTSSVASLLTSLGHDAKTLLQWVDPAAPLETGKWIKRCGEALSAHKLALVCVDVGSETLHITALPWNKLDAALTLGRRVRETVQRFAPKTPLHAPLAAATTSIGAASSRKGTRAHVATPKKTMLQRSWTLVTDATPRVPIFNVKGAATLFQLSSRGAPARVPLADVCAKSVAVSATGTTTLVAGHTRTGTEAGNEWLPAVVTTSRKGTQAFELPKDVTIERAGFLGDVGVCFPEEQSYNDKRVNGPLLVEPGAKTLSLPAGLPPVKTTKNTAYALGGVARTGSGLDVLVLGASGFVRNRKTKRFERVFDVGKAKGSDFSAVPYEGDSFLAVIDETVREVRKSKAPVRRLPKLSSDDRPSGIQPGEGGAVLIGCFLASPKDTACIKWWPRERLYQLVPAKLFGVTRKAFVEHVGYDGATQQIWWVSDGLLFTLPWSATESLPLLSEDSGKPI